MRAKVFSAVSLFVLLVFAYLWGLGNLPITEEVPTSTQLFATILVISFFAFGLISIGVYVIKWLWR